MAPLALLASAIIAPTKFADVVGLLNGPIVARSGAQADDEQKPVRAYWNLTFLASNPAPLTDKAGNAKSSSHDFTNGAHQTAANLATALTAAFGKALGAEDKSAATLRITAVGNSLVIEGKRAEVQQIRRLLATQLYVAQSQILIELNTYQISSNSKAATAADQALKRFTMAQEIARLYKLAHLDAVRSMLIGAKDEIKAEMEKRTSYGLNVPALFRRAGVDPESNRSLGQTDVLTFLAYLTDGTIRSGYPDSVAQTFLNVHGRIDSLVLGPMRASNSKFEQTLATELEALNNALASGGEVQKGKHLDQAILRSMLNNSAVVASFANPGSKGDIENEVTRDAIERFLILWLANADPKIVAELELPSNRQKPAGAAVSAFKNAQLGKADARKFKDLMDGDITARLTRVASRMDDLLAIGVRALQTDGDLFIDRPLERWLEQRVVAAKGSSFGVRFGGTTKLAVTSRAPGITGAESETFFPFQPTSKIGLESLLPILGRTPPKADEADKLAEAGLTPIESTILKGLFDQSEMQPYDRKLGAGIHFSVLPTMLPNGSTARLQLRLSLSVDPGTTASAKRKEDEGAPLDLLKSTVVETELLANAFDIALVSSLKLDISAPGKRDWAVPILSQILPIRSWFVGPTQDKTVRHEAVVLMKVTIVPRAMDLASRSLDLQ